MKNSALVALAGVAIFVIDHVYYFIVNNFVHSPWEHEWYDTIGKLFQLLIIIAWIFIGQYFLTAYRKSK